MSSHRTTTNAHPRRTRIGRPRQWVVLVAAALAVWTTRASAQLDPLLFLKRVAPNILFVIDLGPGMLSDADGNYYDPYQYKWSNSGSDAAWQTALGLVSGVNIANRDGASETSSSRSVTLLPVSIGSALRQSLVTVTVLSVIGRSVSG